MKLNGKEIAASIDLSPPDLLWKSYLACPPALRVPNFELIYQNQQKNCSFLGENKNCQEKVCQLLWSCFHDHCFAGTDDRLKSTKIKKEKLTLTVCLFYFKP